mmetsp:Transcript_58721/g.124515  ORF Transcript_58721/g.124515 Transcript_58721/m.124515 type:complete len:204 (-) Transcript_58721:252-863(-)
MGSTKLPLLELIGDLGKATSAGAVAGEGAGVGAGLNWSCAGAPAGFFPSDMKCLNSSLETLPFRPTSITAKACSSSSLVSKPSLFVSSFPNRSEPIVLACCLGTAVTVTVWVVDGPWWGDLAGEAVQARGDTIVPGMPEGPGSRVGEVLVLLGDIVAGFGATKTTPTGDWGGGGERDGEGEADGTARRPGLAKEKLVGTGNGM